MKGRTRHYKTLKGLLNQLYYGNYLDAETVKCGRANFKNCSFCNFTLSEEAENEFWLGVAKVVWRNPSERQVRNLRYVDTWALRRLMYDKHGFSYCAGQDYPNEIRTIQRQANKN